MKKNNSSFENKQNKIGWRGFITFLIILFLFYFLSFYFSSLLFLNFNNIEIKLKFIFIWCLFPILSLILSILNMMFFRLHSPSDVDASLNEPTKESRIKQAIIQNTLEQSVIAIPIYIISGLYFPLNRLIIIPIASILFFIGRIIFMIGYTYGAPGRAIGFALTIIPSLLLLLEILYYLIFPQES